MYITSKKCVNEFTYYGSCVGILHKNSSNFMLLLLEKFTNLMQISFELCLNCN